MTDPAASLRLPGSIERNLESLRSALRTHVVLGGLCRLAAFAVAGVFVDLGLDRLLRLDRPQRAVMLAASAGLLVWWIYKRFLKAVTFGMDFEQLCLEVEKRHPELRDSLISSVQFCRWGAAAAERANLSAPMMAEVVRSTESAVSGLRFTEVLDRGRFRKALLAGCAAAALLAAFSALAPGTMDLWFRRNVLLSSADWPRACRLSVVSAADGVIRMPRGDDLAVIVAADASGVIPSQVFLRYESAESRSSGEVQMMSVRSGEFSAEMKNVVEGFTFVAYGGDGLTPRCEVKLVDRPRVEGLRLIVTPPAYTGRPVQELPPGEGACPVLSGSKIRIEGGCNNELRSAELRFGKDAVCPMRIGAESRISAELAPDALRSGTYSIMLKDEEGFESKPPSRFSLKIVPDRAPIARVRMNGIGDMITPDATIPLEIELKDDYGLVSCHAAFFAPSIESPARTLPVDGKFPRGATEPEKFEYKFEVEPLRLQPGSHLTFHIEAKDNDTLHGPNVGSSSSFSLKVVSSDELLNEMIRREQEQRQEFERLMADQKASKTDVDALLETLSKADAASNEQHQGLVQNERRQRQLMRRAEAIANQFEQIMAELDNNKLSTDVIRRRLRSGIIHPLRGLAAGPMLAAADHLDASRRAVQKKDPRNASLKSASDEQEKSLNLMRAILKQMLKWEGYHEAINLLRDIMKLQGDVNQETIEEQRRRIMKIFDEDDKPAPKEAPKERQ